MVLHKLHAGSKICLVELVRDVPAERTELTALLTGGQRKGEVKKLFTNHNDQFFGWFPFFQEALEGVVFVVKGTLSSCGDAGTVFKQVMVKRMCIWSFLACKQIPAQWCAGRPQRTAEASTEASYWSLTDPEWRHWKFSSDQPSSLMKSNEQKNVDEWTFRYLEESKEIWICQISHDETKCKVGQKPKYHKINQWRSRRKDADQKDYQMWKNWTR